MKILAFGASTSSTSINRQLAGWVAGQVPGAEVTLLDLNDFEMPIYSEDREAADGVPQAAHDFLAAIAASDALVISFASHNGSYSAAYKNLFDWASRVNPKVYDGKRVILLATSPGPGGAANMVEMATESMPFFGADVVGGLSVPSFYEHFADGAVKPGELRDQLLALAAKLG